MPSKIETYRNKHHRYDQTRRKEDPGLAQAKRFRSSKLWQDYREQHLRKYPFCLNPFEIHDADTLYENQCPHHVVPLRASLDHALDDINVVPVCSACHAEAERREQRGERYCPAFLRWGMDVGFRETYWMEGSE